MRKFQRRHSYLASWTKGVFVKTFEPGIAGIALSTKNDKKNRPKGIEIPRCHWFG
jgi:hypothetical protein